MCNFVMKMTSDTSPKHEQTIVNKIAVSSFAALVLE